MATLSSIGNIITSSNSDSGIRSWAGRVEAMLTAAGWVRTSDTGQTNASALTGVAINTVSGYQVWRMNDSFQATVPVYVRFNFGSSAGVNTAFLQCIIGTGSDGAGNITGELLTTTNPAIGSGGSNIATFYGSGANNRIAMFFGDVTVPHQWVISIERSKDSTGADTSDGLMVLYEQTAGSSFTANFRTFRYLQFGANPYVSSTNIGAFVPNGSTWADSGGIVGVCPVRFFRGQPSNPCLSWLVYLNGDTAVGAPCSVNMYGATHSYMPLGSIIQTAVLGNANSSLMMLYE
jgi:hypothetical protein